MKVVVNGTRLPTRLLTRLVHWTFRTCGVQTRNVLQVIFQGMNNASPETDHYSWHFVDYGLRRAGPKIQVKNGHISAVNEAVVRKFNRDKVTIALYELTLYLPVEEPGEEVLAVGRLHNIVLRLGEALVQMGGPDIPEGDLGFVRQKVGFTFAEQAEKLLKRWGYEANSGSPNGG